MLSPDISHKKTTSTGENMTKFLDNLSTWGCLNEHLFLLLFMGILFDGADMENYGKSTPTLLLSSLLDYFD